MKKFTYTKKRLPPSMISAPRKSASVDADVPNMMLDPRYLRQSSALIQEALQKGFDVLQLASGEIITTGTKTVVFQYIWDDAKGKLVKYKPEVRRADSDKTNATSEGEDTSLDEDA